MSRFPRPCANPSQLFSRSASAVAVLFAILAMAGCGGGGSNGGGGGGGGGGTPSFNLAITPSLPVLAVGDTQTFTATPVDPTTGNPVTVSGLTFSWSSSDTSVATIDMKSGLATLVGVGTTTIEVMATNASGNGVENQVTTLKVANPLMVNPGPLPLGALTTPYITTGLGAGGAAPVTWSLMNGSTLPAGLTLNSNGSVSGTPTIAGVSPGFTVQVMDSETPPVSKQATFSITTVDPANPCSILTSTNPSMLKGSYAFLLQGFQATTASGTPLAMAGSFAANGSGSVTGGELDLNVAAAPQHLAINGGAYAVDASGQGCLQLKYSGGGSNVFHFALSQLLDAGNVATHGRIIEFDGYQGAQGGSATNLASGVLLLQNPAEFSSSSLAPRFAFGQDGFDMSGKHVAIGGTFNLNNANGNLTNFAQDFDDGGAISTVTGATGAVTSTATTATTGRETVAITLPGPTTVHVAAYIVNANEMLLVSTDALSASSPISSGRAIVTDNSYATNSFSGNYIYRAEGTDYESDGAACAASGPCALTDVVILNANPGSGALTGTLYQSQAGATQTSTIANTTYSVNSSSGRVQLSSAAAGTLPVYYLAAPVTAGTDTTESIAAFLVGSGPTVNSSTGDPTALFGLIEAQPNSPYALNSPPPYILATEDPGQITAANVVGSGSSSSGTISPLRDVSGTAGLQFSSPTSFSLTVNANGTLSGAAATPNLAGVTNSTSASPGKALVISTVNTPAGIRVFEP